MAKKTSAIVSGLPGVSTKIDKLVQKLAHSDEVYNFIGSEITSQMKKRTQGGINDYKQPALKPISVEVRKQLAKYNQTDKLYSAPRSNLTFTGQLLNSISYTINTAARQISIYLKDFRKDIEPVPRGVALTAYDKALDKDHNISNKKAKNQDERLKIKALFIASKPPVRKGNNQIKEELKDKGRVFFLVSRDLTKKIEDNLSTFIRKNKAELIKKYLRR